MMLNMVEMLSILKHNRLIIGDVAQNRTADLLITNTTFN